MLFGLNFEGEEEGEGGVSSSFLTSLTSSSTSQFICFCFCNEPFGRKASSVWRTWEIEDSGDWVGSISIKTSVRKSKSSSPGIGVFQVVGFVRSPFQLTCWNSLKNDDKIDTQAPLDVVNVGWLGLDFILSWHRSKVSLFCFSIFFFFLIMIFFLPYRKK